MKRIEKILAVALFAAVLATGSYGKALSGGAIGGAIQSIAGKEAPGSAGVPGAATAGNKELAPTPVDRLEFPGFSILPPRGDGWKVLSSEEAMHSGFDVLFRKTIDPAESVHAYAAAHRTSTGFAVPAQILRRAVNQLIKPQGRLLRTSSDSLDGASCIRWEMTREPAAARLDTQRGGGRMMSISRYHGYLCSHPDAPAYVVEIGYFETLSKGTHRSLVPEEDDSFLKALAFTPLGVKVAQFSAGSESRGIAFGYDALWVTEEAAGVVSRINPKTGALVAKIPVGKRPEGFAIGLGAVWVPNWASNTVSRIDPKTNRVVGTVPVGRGPSDVAVEQGAVWITNEKDSSVSRLDPGTNQVTAVLHTKGRPVVIAAGHDALWAENFETSEIWRIDPKINQVVATIRVGRGRHLITANKNAVWVSNAADDSVSRINPETNRVVATVPVGGGPMGLALAGGALWVANFGSSTILRIDSETNQIKGKPIPVGESPFFLSANGPTVWALSEWGHWEYSTLSRIDF